MHAFLTYLASSFINLKIQAKRNSNASTKENTKPKRRRVIMSDSDDDDIPAGKL